MCQWLLLLDLLVLCGAHNMLFQPTHPDFGVLSDQEIDYINSLKTTWKAGRNFHTSRLKGVLRRLGARKPTKDQEQLPVKTGSMGLSLPDNFDPRTKWPKCKSLSEIRDQGDCGSCWVFGAVESMTDRICIHSKGAKTPHISAEDLLACCQQCGYGCEGGYPFLAWKYWVEDGIVTGGQYGSEEGCQPYTIKPCDHDTPGKYHPCTGDIAPTPQCSNQCEKNYNSTYFKDKNRGARSYSIKGVQTMMEELYTNGPFEVVFDVYSDFLNYKSGVYQHTGSGSMLGEHAVKMMGWGVENGTPYWLIANSWNTDWGDKGYFKILRGKDECKIEDSAVGGIPQ